MKKAFTLAEVMIVLAVIGVLVAILLPTAQNMTPDENLLKFKKANTTLITAIRELVNSDKYYYDGDLGLDKEGNKIVEAKYFCSTLADILTTKKVECSDNNLGYNSTALANLPNIETDEIDGVKIYEYADCMCKQHIESGEEIKLSDNTIIYTINPYYHFGSLIDGSDKRLFNLCSNEKRYKFICMDIDNLNEGEDPFGYALRADGKIIYGARAQAWVESKINDDSEIAIATTDSCTPTALTITPENDVCKVVQAPTPTPEPASPCGNLALEITADGKNLCIMKFNAGDDAFNHFQALGKTALANEAKAFELPLTISKTTVGSATCTPSESNFCCLVGNTSISCDATNGGYSGCTRTVCDWRAANEYCSKLAYKNRSWRLPTEAEMGSIATQLNNIQFNQGANGLMLCDGYSGYFSTECKKNENCTGSYFGACYPYSYWCAETSGNKASNYDLEQGAMTVEVQNKGLVVSVRCVSDL